MTSGDTWRVDDLAHRANVTVDTIRYYTREGLLPPPRRSGRHKVYGPRHLDRLERIRHLRDAHFSLAAIRLLLDSDRPGLEAIFTDSGPTYDVDRLVDCSGLDRDFVERLRVTGLLPDPATLGRESYDTADLRMLEAVDELRRLGLPEALLIELAHIYVDHFRSLQEAVLALFSDGAGHGAPGADGDLDELQRTLSRHAARLVPAVNRIALYVHQRTLEAMALDALRTGAGSDSGRDDARPTDDPPSGTVC